MVRCKSCCYFLRYLGIKEWKVEPVLTHTIQCQRFSKPIDMDREDCNYQDCSAYIRATKDIENQIW